MNKAREANGRFASKKPTQNQAKKIVGGNGDGTTLNNEQMIVHDMAKNVSMAMNAMTSRRKLYDQWLDPRRNIDDECGYPQTLETDDRVYTKLYKREPIARRVVDVLPLESWQTQPKVFETEDEGVTPFEKSWEELDDNLKGPSWFTDEDKQGSLIWEYLLRVDKLSGIGSYGVILLGINDGKPLHEPAEPKEGQKLLFIRVFEESLAPIAEWDTDQTSPRFGQPVSYELKFSDPENYTSSSTEPSFTETKVHHTRVIHIADNLVNSEVFGTPRMEPVYNRLYDLIKLYGGSAEMYWKGAFFGLSFETHPQLGTDVTLETADLDSLKTQIEDFQNGLQRYIATQGMTANSLSPQVVDPTPQIDAYLKAICILIAIPKRIFEGSERGELASSQDAKQWFMRIRNRQENYLSPRVISPFIDRLILLKILAEPVEGYQIEWPDGIFLTDDEKATVALKQVQAITAFVQGGGTSIMEESDFLNRIVGMGDDEVEAILEAKVEALEGEASPTDRSPLLSMVGGITGMADLFDKRNQGALSDIELKAMLKLIFELDDTKVDALVEENKEPPAEPPQEGGGFPPKF